MNIRHIKLLDLKQLKYIEYLQFTLLRYNKDLLIDYKISQILINDKVKEQSNFYQKNKVLSIEQRQQHKLLLDLIK